VINYTNQLTYDLCDELMDGILRHFNLTTCVLYIDCLDSTYYR